MIGLSIKQFSLLLPIFDVLITAQIEENKVDKEKPNNGKVGALVTAKDKLIFILYYLKCYPTYNQFGFVFNMSGSSAYTGLHKIIPNKKPRKSKSNPHPKLTKEQKEENKEMSKERVIVENGIGGMKWFRSSPYTQLIPIHPAP